MASARCDSNGCTAWDALRACWAQLECARPRAPLGEAALPADLNQRHAEALEALVAGGELGPAVAGEIAGAFEELVDHIQRSMALCYMAFSAAQMGRQDLMGQVAALEAMAGESDLDPDTVAQVRAALERDMAWLARVKAGDAPPWLPIPSPSGPVEQTALEVDETTAEAARVLVRLLQGGRS